MAEPQLLSSQQDLKLYLVLLRDGSPISYTNYLSRHNKATIGLYSEPYGWFYYPTIEFYSNTGIKNIHMEKTLNVTVHKKLEFLGITKLTELSILDFCSETLKNRSYHNTYTQIRDTLKIWSSHFTGKECTIPEDIPLMMYFGVTMLKEENHKETTKEQITDEGIIRINMEDRIPKIKEESSWYCVVS